MQARKTVSILFCDVVDSTPLGEQLDPESLQRVMSRWFAEARTIVERHGGTVEKFIGDEVMAVFGVPVIHEDDALRAVSSAAALRDRLETLNDELEALFGVRLAVRIGVNTGEVVVGDPSSGSTFVTGEPVNLAKRLEQAANPGQILIGKATYPLVENAVRAGPLESFSVKGKRDVVSPWTVEHVEEGASGVARRLDAPLVGRTAELERLVAAFEATADGGTCRLVTLLGPAGIGKTRLTDELAGRLGTRARLLTGRCLPYGDGITFWPLVEVLRALGPEGLDAALTNAPDRDAVGARLAAVTGQDATASVDELFWAARRLVESIAAERPLVFVLEDFDRAEPTLCDLVEYLHSRVEAPVLLLCLARADLLDRRPGWASPRERAETVMLEPLSESDAGTLLTGLGAELNETARERVLRSAEGNPLYVEQLAALAGSGELVVPATIQALIAERLDRLEPGERAILERAAIVGQEFSRRSVTDLCPPELRADVGRHLLALVRKELVRPHASASSTEDGFRFGHALIRDVTYEGMPKEARALFHEWFADWLDRNAGERLTEIEEIVGYHLEQAVRLRNELGPADARTQRLAARAAERLGSAGRRAHARGDLPAAVSLLERAAALVPASPAGVELRVDLGAALRDAGRLSEAASVLEAALEDARVIGDDRLEALASIERASMRMYTDPEDALPAVEESARRAIAVFERHADDAALARAWRLVGGGEFARARFTKTIQALERASSHARRAGDAREERTSLWRLAVAFSLGPVPVEAALEQVREIENAVRDDRVGSAIVTAVRAGLHAMSLESGKARAAYADSKALLEELGDTFYLGGLPLYAGPVEYLLGDLEAAELELRRGYDMLERIGAKSALSTASALLGRVTLDRGDFGQATRWADETAETASPDDLFAEALWRATRARLLTVEGDHAAAVALADEAAEIAARTESPVLQGDIELDRALVLAPVDTEAAGGAREAALARYRAKGDQAALARASSLLASTPFEVDAPLEKA